MELEGFVKAEWRKEGNIPVIYLYCREGEKKKEIRIDWFRPYFYIGIEEVEKAKSLGLRVEETTKRTLLGNKEVLRVYVNTPTDIYHYRKLFNNTYEADVLFISRFLVDCVDSIQKTTPFVLYFDIETTSDYGFPDNENPVEQIISISFTHNFTDTTYLLMLRPPNKEIGDVVEKNKRVKVFDDEKKMIEFFFTVLAKLFPDVLTAWNIRFDINYLLARAKYLGVNVERYIHINHTNQWGDVDIWGINVFDMLQGFKQIYLAELPSYSLEYVAKMLLGEEEQKIKVLNIGEKWREDPQFIAEYNIRDVVILRKIDQKVKVIDYWLTIMHLGFLPNLQQCQAFSFVLDNIILKKFKDKYIFPNKPHEKKISIGGGYVKQPTRGIFDWVYVFDFSAMYPSIIKTFNLSKDTIVEKGEGDYRINDVWWLCEQTKRGVLPQILDEMIAVRKKYKAEMKKYEPGTPEYELWFLKQFAMKFLINSVGPDTLVPVRKKGTDNLEWVEIKDLENCWQEYETLVNVPGTDKFEWCEIKGFVKEKPADRKIVRIKTKYNYEIDLSTNHSIYVLENGKEVMKKGSELKVGDKVVVLNLLGSSEDIKINLWKYLKDDVDYILDLPFKHTTRLVNLIKELNTKGYVYKNGSRKIFKFLLQHNLVRLVREYNGRGGYRKKWIVEDKKAMSFLHEVLNDNTIRVINGKRYLRVRYDIMEKYSNEESVLKFIYACTKFHCHRGNKYPVLLPIDDNFIKFVAFYVSEGSISTNCITLSQKDDRFDDVVKKFCAKYNITYKRTRMLYYVYSKMFSLLFERMCGKGSLRKRLPSFVYKLGNNKLLLLLKYLIMDNGSEEKYAYTYNTVSPVLAEQLISLFNFRISTEKTQTNKTIYHLYLNKNGLEEYIAKIKRYVEIKEIIVEDYDGYLYDLTVPPYYDFVGGKVGVFRLRDSTYGVNAFPSFRLYDRRVGDTITYIGRTIAQYVAEQVEKRLGYRVLYQDTDSVFIHIGKKDWSIIEGLEKQLNAFTAEIVEKLSDGKANNYMKIEMDKVFDKVLFCEKKRYIGRMVYKDGKEVEPQYKFVGVDLKRNNIPAIVKEGLDKFVRLLFEENEEEARQFVRKFVSIIQQTNDIEKFAIPTKIEKVYKTNVPQQRAADFANKKWKLGFKPGSKFYSIWVRLPETDIIGFDVPERAKEFSDVINKQKYVDMFLQKVGLLYDIDASSLFNTKLTDWF